MAGWYLTDLPRLCLGAAVLELDAVHIGQWMLSRPLVLGPISGWACGDVWLGVRLGVFIELLLVKELPVGNVLPLNGAFATAAAVLLSCGASHVEPAAALPVGLILGNIHRRIENRIRRWRTRFTQMAEEALDRGKPIPFLRILTYSLGGHALLTAAFLFAAVATLGPALSWGWIAAPEAVRLGLRWALEAVPWLGLAGLMQAFWK